MLSIKLLKKTAELLSLCQYKKIKIATAESCTGGLLAAHLTEIAGASSVFIHGFITYSNEAKINFLDVPAVLLKKYGAVSQQAAYAMAHGCIKKTQTDLVISVTGIAGPDGGSDQKPIGTVYFCGLNSINYSIEKHYIFKGNRTDIRLNAVKEALEILYNLAK
ncbi:MAG: CinA family protein [Alphaproteobacteria bacterium]|nr:CinA family protein [Alphaproteobacteria bacterium]